MKHVVTFDIFRVGLGTERIGKVALIRRLIDQALVCAEIKRDPGILRERLQKAFARLDASVVVESTDIALSAAAGDFSDRIPLRLIGLDVGETVGIGFRREVPILLSVAHL